MEAVRVESGQLRKGMFISELDRPWMGTPFMFQGFRVDTDTELSQLRDLCDFVYVDRNRSETADGEHPAAGINPASPVLRMERFQTRRRQLSANAAPPRYPLSVPVEEELPRAEQVRTRAVSQVQQIFHSIQTGKTPDTRGAIKLAEDMVASIIRNPDAMVWLSQLRSKDEYTALHSVNVCVLSLAFGRHMGLAEGKLLQLGLGALLHDVGKLRVPSDVLNKPERLTAAEFRLIQLHPAHGLDILGGSHHQAATTVLDIAYSHHERCDGRGYPRGLKAGALTLFSRMVAIVDVYDALSSDRIYHKGMSSDETLAKLYDWSQRELDARLVGQFIQCLGLFPVGTLVELSSAEIGVVIEINRRQPRKSKVLLVLDRNGKALAAHRIVDLSRRQGLFSRGDGPQIEHALTPNSHGIDAAALAAAHV